MAIGFTEYAAGWEYVENERGVTCTRVFHYDPDSTVDVGVEPPAVGDAYTFPPVIASGFPITGVGPTVSGLVCRSTSYRALAGDIRKFEYNCSYNNEPVDKGLFIDPTKPGSYVPSNPTEIPLSIEYSGEFTNLNPDSSSYEWQWKDNSNDVKQPIASRVNQFTYRFTRYIGNNTSPYSYQNFQINCQGGLGHVNDAADPFGLGGCGIGCLLFVGCNSEVFRDSYDTKWWRVELEFIYRNPDALDTQGWQKVMRLDGSWQIPIKKSDSKPLYKYANFQALFDEAKVITSAYVL